MNHSMNNAGASTCSKVVTLIKTIKINIQNTLTFFDLLNHEKVWNLPMPYAVIKNIVFREPLTVRSQ